MAIPQGAVTRREAAMESFARKLSNAEYERESGIRKKTVLTGALAETVRECFGPDAAAAVGGLEGWLAFTTAAEALDHNLRAECARGSLGRFLSGVTPNNGGWDFATIFRDATNNLFNNLDALNTSTSGQ